jgi:PAS domain S-box-containing protein
MAPTVLPGPFLASFRVDSNVARRRAGVYVILMSALWKLTRRLFATVWSGCLAVTAGELMHASQPRPVQVGGETLAAGLSWLPWLELAAGALAVAGLLLWWKRRANRLPKSPDEGAPPAQERDRQLFDQTPVQILVEDWTGVEELLSRLRTEGVTDMITHLAAHPDLPRECLSRVRLFDANQPAVAAAGFADRQEMIACFPQHAVAPYLDVFRYQVGALWAGRRQFQEEFHYLETGGHERVCLMQCRLQDHSGRPDFSRVVVVLIDVSTAKSTVSAQMEKQDLVRRILAGSDILLWWAQVRRENGQMSWKINVPEQLADTPLFKLAMARDRGGLWESGQVPEYEEIGVRAIRAMITDSPGYKHDFCVFSREGATHWVNENVGISRVGPDEWNLVGVVMDVTAQHEAEEARKASEARLRQILNRADCLLWHASVRRVGDELQWRNFTMPSSGLCYRMFGANPPATGTGLWYPADTQDLAEMNRRSSQAVLSGAPGYEQEFPIYRSQKTLWLHEQVSITSAGPDDWELVGVLIDVTTQHEAEEARRASEARLQQLLTQADCMLWQAQVTENSAGSTDWILYIPKSSLYRELFGVDPSEPPNLMWSELRVPELPEMNARATAAIRGGLPGYEQEFRAQREGHSHFLREQVSITPVSPGRWSLVGVITDVTAARQAEEARRATEARLQQILDRADCMLWQARVTEVDGKLSWLFDVPVSGLQRRIFGCEGLAGSSTLYEHKDFTVPEISEMYVLGATALRRGAPSYEHEFRIVKSDHTYWLHERGIITPQGPGRWLVFGLVIDISALKQAEQVIRASENRYRDLFEGAVEGVFQSTPEGRFVSVNPSLARIFDCATPAEFLAWSDNGTKSLYVLPRRREEFFFELGARDSVTDFQSEVRCRNGGVKWISENVRAVRDAGGHLLHLQGFITDVTERRRALMAIQESESRYRALFENIPVAILELDLCDLGRMLQRWHAAGVQDLTAHLAGHPGEFAALAASVRVAAVNETAVRLTNADSKEHLQSEIAGLFTTQGLGVLQRWLESIWQGHNDGEAEAELGDFVGGGHHTYLRWWMPRQAEWLQLEHAVVALVDLTELKSAEAALAAEKERLTVTLRAMAEGVITTDTHGYVLFMNRAAEELTQYSAVDALGRPLAEICVLARPRSDEAFVLPLARVLEERVLVDLPPQTRLTNRDGGTYLVEGCCAPVHDAESEVIGTVLVIRDVTVRQRFEQELERASRLESIGILAGGIAHDFNNILTAIMGNITLALLDANGLATVERYLQEAERATLRARDLTQQLLTFAKGGDPVRAAVLLPEIIREVAEFALHGSRVKCAFDLPAGLWPADADRGQLGQVVQNLVINAVQAMPEGGTIRIGASNETVAQDSKLPLRPGDYVHISVADMGTGIRAEHLARIFDPYFTTKQHGSGLGLTTVYSIIRKHQGHIEAESELGHGTTFHFWLPALREERTEMVEERDETVTPMSGRVLFMDDEESIIAMAGGLLLRLGFEVELARDGAEAVTKFSEARAAGRPFDVVVMDLTVPGGIGGREAINQLRRIDPNVRAIVSSGYSSDPVLANHRAYGFRGMVAKPYRVEDFARVLRMVLRESRPPFAGDDAPPPAGT